MTSTAADVPTVSDDSDLTAGDGAKASVPTCGDAVEPSERWRLYSRKTSRGSTVSLGRSEADELAVMLTMPNGEVTQFKVSGEAMKHLVGLYGDLTHRSSFVEDGCYTVPPRWAAIQVGTPAAPLSPAVKSP